MGKKRIYELAKEINVPSKDLLETAEKKGYDFKNHMASIDDHQEKVLRDAFAKGQTTAAKPTSAPKATPAAHKAGEKTESGKIKINKAAIRRRPEADKKTNKSTFFK